MRHKEFRSLTADLRVLEVTFQKKIPFNDITSLIQINKPIQ